MIVVLCNSFWDVKDAYDCFVTFLEENEPWSIVETYDAAYCVETDDDLRFIFVDYRMQNLFKDMTPDYIDMVEFFEGLEDYYPGTNEFMKILQSFHY